MKYQTDPKLNFDASEDCFFFDVLKVFELEAKYELPYAAISEIRKISVRANFMRQDGYLNEKGISGIASVASGLTGHHIYIKRVGSHDNYNHIIALYERRTNSDKLVHHFVLADYDKPDKMIMFDPWSVEGSKTGREGYVIEFRYLFAEAI